ncbi:hypothetical protein Q7P37_008549 [Cladosporium fusiforme]
MSSQTFIRLMRSRAPQIRSFAHSPFLQARSKAPPPPPSFKAQPYRAQPAPPAPKPAPANTKAPAPTNPPAVPTQAPGRSTTAAAAVRYQASPPRNSLQDYALKLLKGRDSVLLYKAPSHTGLFVACIVVGGGLFFWILTTANMVFLEFSAPWWAKIVVLAGCMSISLARTAEKQVAFRVKGSRFLPFQTKTVDIEPGKAMIDTNVTSSLDDLARGQTGWLNVPMENAHKWTAGELPRPERKGGLLNAWPTAQSYVRKMFHRDSMAYVRVQNLNWKMDLEGCEMLEHGTVMNKLVKEGNVRTSLIDMVARGVWETVDWDLVDDFTQPAQHLRRKYQSSLKYTERTKAAMAGLVNSARLSARVAGRYANNNVARRGFMASAADRAAQNFSMPALSPTMTEGNIASWKIKEGDSFSAGDVILEIETDKATMDVEAQDEGILFKIIRGDETKGVKVGERIAVTAEEGDDISSMEIPAESSAPAKAEAPKEEKKEEQQQKPAAPKADTSAPTQQTQGGKAQKQKYPLYPAVQHLLIQNGLPKEEADKIPASGPNGRLLKGDVLAYIGKISKNYPSESAARFTKLSHLDLSNIQLAAPPPPPKAAEEKKPAAAAAPELPKETEVALPISLSAVLATQKRVEEALGIPLPLSTFVARATELANEALPAAKTAPTADDLFNSVLGLDTVARSSRGNFLPSITALGPVPYAAPSRASSKPDIIDLLTPKAAAKPAPRTVRPGALGVASAGPNVFSVSAKSGEEKRAMEFLERMKLVLEQEPGRLVL